MEGIYMVSVRDTTVEQNSTTQRGSKVRVKLHGGAVVERFVWDFDDEEDVVYLCNHDVFLKLTAGSDEVRPVGFPIDSIVRTPK
jgi:hypothetical protein